MATSATGVKRRLCARLGTAGRGHQPALLNVEVKGLLDFVRDLFRDVLAFDQLIGDRLRHRGEVAVAFKVEMHRVGLAQELLHGVAARVGCAQRGRRRSGAEGSATHG